MGNFTYRDMQKSGVQIMFRGVRDLKMVPKVFIDIDDNNKAQEKLICESQYFRPTPNKIWLAHLF